MRRVAFIIWFAAIVGIASLVTALNVGAQTDHATHATQGGDQPSERQGRTIWLRNCAVCHGADASGGHGGPDIRNRGAAAVDFMVTTGRMPLPDPGAELKRRTSPFTAEQQRALVRYASTLVTGRPIPDVTTKGADLGAGGDAFRQSCATCHQSTGSGGALPFGKNAPSLAQATPTQVVEALRIGPGAMPPFGTQAVSRAQADQIAAYVQRLREPTDPGGVGLGHLGPVSEGLIAWVFGLGAMILITRLLGRLRHAR